MTDPRNNAPRRYFVDADGRRVLIGLTLEETFEFERLDIHQVVNKADDVALRDEAVLWLAAGERRWHELYAKHEGAWKAWMAQSRGADVRGGFSLY